MKHYLPFIVIVSAVPVLVAILNLAARPTVIDLDGHVQQIDIAYGQGGMLAHCNQGSYTITCQAASCTATGQETQATCMPYSIEVTQTITARAISYDLINALGNALVNLESTSNRDYDPVGIVCIDHTDDYPYVAATITTDRHQTISMDSTCNAVDSKLWKVNVNGQWYNQVSGEIPAAYYPLLWALRPESP